jgi:hypothetical protein
MLHQYGLDEVLHVSDPTQELYRAYPLVRASLWHMFSPRVWWRGFKAAILRGKGFGKVNGDVFQLGGSFLVQNGKVLQSHPAKSAADPIPFECLLK